MLLWDLKDYAQMLGFKTVSPSCTYRRMHSDTITPPVLDLHQLQEMELIVLRKETPRRQKSHKDLESHQQDERKSVDETQCCMTDLRPNHAFCFVCLFEI